MAMRHSALGLLLPLAVAFAAGADVPLTDQVLWRAADAPAFVANADIAAVLAELDPAIDAPHVAIQMVRHASESERAALRAAGIRLGAPLGGLAFFGAIDRKTFNPASPAMALVAGAQAIDPRWKLHPSFTADDPAAWIRVGTIAAADGTTESVVALYVLLHADVANDAKAAAVVAGHGGTVRGTLAAVNAMVVEMPLSRAGALAAEDMVQWIEPALPPLTPTNAENRALTRVNQVNAAPYNLNGAGVTALVFDSGSALASHQDFGGRLTVIDGSGTQNHPTHVSGTIGGSGAASGGAHRGMAPGVTLLSAGLNATPGFLYTDPCDIEDDYTDAIELGADVANNSIGTNTEPNGYPCEWQGNYGITDALIDAIVLGHPAVSGGNPFRVVWAAGNERQGNRCDVEGVGDYRSMAPPACAKNHLCVGAINANDESMTSFSSWGPTDDGRLKPDFCAPGCQSNGDNGVTSSSSSSATAYSVACGTSMACPTTTGIVALMLQDWKNQYPARALPRNSTLKAMLAQTAVDLGNPGPDYIFGYGSIRADAAIDLIRSGAHTERSLNHGFRDYFTVTVPPGSGPLQFTIAWDDVPATPNVIPSLINDLDLHVYAPGGQRHHPWTLNPAVPSANAQRTQEDHLNNIEQVRVDSPVPGEWTIEVRGYSIPSGSQVYSFVSSNATVTHTGSISFAVLPVAVAPPYVEAGVQIPMEIHVDAQGDSIVEGSVSLRYRWNGGAYLQTPMTGTGGGLFEVAIPSQSCYDVLEYYFSAQSATFGIMTHPPEGAAAPLAATVGQHSIPVFDDMEAESGWVVGAPGDSATAGIWNRMAPQATAAQPGFDVTVEGVNCWVTDGLSGGSLGARDVDGGATTLLSPVYDLSAPGNYTISYWRWYSNDTSANPSTDPFTVDVTADGSTWVNVETIITGPHATAGWNFHSFELDDFVSASSTVRLRFVAADFGGGSIVEAAIDDLTIEWVTCDDSCAADFDGNSLVEVTDIFVFLTAWFNGEPAAYEFGGTPGVPAIFAFLTAWFAGC